MKKNVKFSLFLCFPLLYRLAFRFLPDWFAVSCQRRVIRFENSMN